MEKKTVKVTTPKPIVGKVGVWYSFKKYIPLLGWCQEWQEYTKNNISPGFFLCSTKISGTYYKYKVLLFDGCVKLFKDYNDEFEKVDYWTVIKKVQE